MSLAGGTFLVLLAALLLPNSLAAGEAAGPLVLWYEKPASRWEEALAVGNGRLGAMVFGGTERERIQFNDDALWAGRPHDYSHEGAARHLPEIRRLLFEGRQREAHALGMRHFMSEPLRQMPYQPFGDLTLTVPGHDADNVEAYRRELDLDRAVATTRYRVDGVTFTREVFASHPQQVIVVRLAADQPGKLSFTATLSSPHQATLTKGGPDLLLLRGRVGPTRARRSRQETEGALRFEARLRAVASGGTVTSMEEGLRISGARTATLYLAGATNYLDFEDLTADPAARNESVLSSLSGKSYEELLRAHTADHRRLFRRVDLDLGTGDAANEPTDRRLKAFGPHDPRLAVLYFQFGRYLMIAGSRPGSQPLNLQGIWNESRTPPWESKYTVNINTDETGWWLENNRASLWVMCNSTATYYRVVRHKDRDTLHTVVPPDWPGVLVSDCLSVYDGATPLQQKCYSHHLKAISAAARQRGSPGGWLNRIKLLLQAAMALDHTRDTFEPEDFVEKTDALKRQARTLLTEEPRRCPHEESVRNRLWKQRDHLFIFLDHEGVDATNNLAERQIRPAVIRRKLSCGNRSPRGAHSFEVLTSLAATCRQRGTDFLRLVANAAPLQQAH